MDQSIMFFSQKWTSKETALLKALSLRWLSCLKQNCIILSSSKDALQNSFITYLFIHMLINALIKHLLRTKINFLR